MATTTTSGKFNLGSKDFWKGLIMAVGAPVLYILQELIPGWNVPPYVKVALAAMITYLLKNFFAPAQIVISDPTDAQVKKVEAGTASAKIVDHP